MTRIYVHIPFCRRNCSYCDFYFSLNKKHEPRFVRALLKEIDQRKEEIIRKGPVQSIYFGGGTPSYLLPENLHKILHFIFKNFEISPGAEITLEANPDDITPENLQAWRTSGVNRFSLGVQSFFDSHLQLMNRSHDAQTARRAIELIRDAGFTNFNMDLIYGIPGMTTAEWKENIRIFLDYKIPHLSAYALTVEKNTLLEHRVRKGQIQMPPDETVEKQYFILDEMLENAGYKHYEISNFAKAGMESRHNRSYWTGEAYAGFGPSAHSYDGKNLREWNVANIHRYMQGVEEGKQYRSAERLTPTDRFNEYMLMGLRTAEGIYPTFVEKNFRSFYAHFSQILNSLDKEGKIRIQNNRAFIPTKHWLIADHIIRRFFVVEA